jgi:DNA-binding NarL/FixJ family response regulator
MVKVLIVDDHPHVRRVLQEAVSKSEDLIVTGELNNGLEVLKEISQNDYEVILLDISLPGLNGLEVLRQVKHQEPVIKVLMLSIHKEKQYVLRALSYGACGYLAKESATDELVTAIHEIMLGRIYISDSLATKLSLDLH